MNGNLTENRTQRGVLTDAEKKLAMECKSANEFGRKFLQQFPDFQDLRHINAVWANRSKFIKEAKEAQEAKEAEMKGKIVLRTSEPIAMYKKRTNTRYLRDPPNAVHNSTRL